MNNANPGNEWVEINGIKYKVDREVYTAEDESHVIYRGARYNLRNGYYKRARDFSKDKPCNLHRAIWLDHFGSIPDKHHVHHIDSNRKNNRIENLQCLDGFTHLSRAAKTNKWIKSKENKENLNKAREKAIKWQKSKEGSEFHRKTAQKRWANQKKTLVKCVYCGKEFEASFPSRAKYCHKNCLENARKKSGVENVNRPCVICQKYFIINKYCDTVTCSPPCSQEYQRQNRIKRKANK